MARLTNEMGLNEINNLYNGATFTFNPDGSRTVNWGNQGGGLSGFNWAGLAAAGAGLLQGLAGLRQAQMAEKQLGLAKNQFLFQSGLARRNLANQAQIINNTYKNAALVSAGLQGTRNADGTYGATDQATKDAYANAAKSKYVSGAI